MTNISLNNVYLEHIDRIKTTETHSLYLHMTRESAYSDGIIV